MKKMTKVLALLTVMAMLATLFVALPASAITNDELRAAYPEADVVFTSDDAGATVVDPNTLSVGDTFYAWIVLSELPVGAYVSKSEAVLAWDSDVVEPAGIDPDDDVFKGFSGMTDPDPSYALVYSADFDYDSFIFHSEGSGSRKKYYGIYQEGYTYNGTNGCTVDDIFGYAVLPTGDANVSKSSDIFVEVPASGELTFFGYGFVKTADGNVGVTIAGPNKTLNGKAVLYNTAGPNNAVSVQFCDQEDHVNNGALLATYNYNGAGNIAVRGFIDNSPVDSAATEAPTEAPTDEPEPTLEPVEGEKQASKSALSINQNAFFYEFATPIIPGEVTGLTATFQIPGKDAKEGVVRNINLTGLSNVALQIAAVVKNIPAGQEDTEVTTSYILTYEVGGVQKTLEWSRTNSLN